MRVRLPNALSVFAVIGAAGALRELHLDERAPMAPPETRLHRIDDESVLTILVKAAESAPDVVCRTNIGGAQSINSPDVWAPRALRAVRGAP